MEVSSRRLAIVQHCHLPARGLLSLLSLLSAFLLTGIKRNQAESRNQKAGPFGAAEQTSRNSRNSLTVLLSLHWPWDWPFWSGYFPASSAGRKRKGSSGLSSGVLRLEPFTSRERSHPSPPQKGERDSRPRASKVREQRDTRPRPARGGVRTKKSGVAQREAQSEAQWWRSGGAVVAQGLRTLGTRGGEGVAHGLA